MAGDVPALLSSLEHNTQGGQLHDEKEALAALDQIANALRDVDADLAIDLDLSNYCETYHDLKPLIEMDLGLVQMIPVYWKKMAAAVR